MVIDGKLIINIEDLAWEAQSRKEILELIVAEAGGLDKAERGGSVELMGVEIF